MRTMASIQRTNGFMTRLLPNDSPQGVLRLSGRELLFGEAGRINANRNGCVLSVTIDTY